MAFQVQERVRVIRFSNPVWEREVVGSLGTVCRIERCRSRKGGEARFYLVELDRTVHGLRRLGFWEDEIEAADRVIDLSGIQKD
jgi:hypothetical protein